MVFCTTYIHITCTLEHSIIKNAHISLTSYKNLKNNIWTNWITPKGPEAFAQEYSTRRTQICRVYVCSGTVWEVILKEEVENGSHKIRDSRSGSSSAKVFHTLSRIFVALLFFLGVIFCGSTGGAIQLCMWRCQKDPILPEISCVNWIKMWIVLHSGPNKQAPCLFDVKFDPEDWLEKNGGKGQATPYFQMTLEVIWPAWHNDSDNTVPAVPYQRYRQ